jgi:nucleotide-binding universal stress UspA family protein
MTTLGGNWGNPMYKKVLLCYDGTLANHCALQEGTRLVVQLRAEAYVLAIVSSASLGASAAVFSGAYSTQQSEDEYRRRAEEIAADLRQHGVRASGHVVFGLAIEEIPKFARKFACDLVVVGHKSRKGLGRWWSGGDNVALADRAPCSVLISIEGRAAIPTSTAGSRLDNSVIQ